MFTFTSGNIALDFAGTLQYRRTARVELLDRPTALGRWFIAAELLDTAPDPTTDDLTTDNLAAAVELREVIYRLAAAASTGQTMPDNDIDTLNAAADGHLPRLELTRAGALLRHGDTRSGLTAIARGAVTMLGGPECDRISECRRPTCTRLYVDTSRNRSRRWCDMTVCGNRVKSASFRARHHTAQ